jgi:hypothetical protein
MFAQEFTDAFHRIRCAPACIMSAKALATPAEPDLFRTSFTIRICRHSAGCFL